MRRTASQERRGAVIIEAALVTPLLLVIICGIVEMALMMKADHALSALVSAGGRSASSAAVGDVVRSSDASQGCSLPCSATRAPVLADEAAAAVGRADSRFPKDTIDELWVYKANHHGFPGASGNTGFGSCVRSCVVYRWNPADHAFDYVSGQWRAEGTGSCLATPSRVGVYIKARHSFLDGLLSRGVHLSDHAVFSVKPAGSARCSAE